jgi:RNA polymerase sigma factor (sigma-70 family)
MMSAMATARDEVDEVETGPRAGASARSTGFESAFRDLYPRAFRLALRMVGNHQAAEDIASETMARALLRWDRLDADRLPGWVLRVTANQAIDLLRRRGRTLEPGVVDLEDATTLRIALADALRRLPRRQREAVALRYLSDLSEADTAAALGISTGAVKTHVHRGLAALRSTLGDDQMEAVGAGSD